MTGYLILDIDIKEFVVVWWGICLNQVVVGILKVNDCPDDKYPDIVTVEDTKGIPETLDDESVANSR